MYFKVFITQSWCKKTGEGRRRFDQRLPEEKGPRSGGCGERISPHQSKIGSEEPIFDSGYGVLATGKH